MNKNIKLFEQFITESKSTITLIRGEGRNIGSAVDLFGRGLYLTDDIEVAKFYGDIIKEFEITGKIYDTTKDFTSSELRKFTSYMDIIFDTKEGSKYLQDIINYNDGRLPKNTEIDYVGVSWALNSNYEFSELLKKHNLNQNDFNSYANTCTAMNMILSKMGYVGLKYSTSEIEDLEEAGLDRRNAFVIFNDKAIKAKKD
jgi:hypothetical protein